MIADIKMPRLSDSMEEGTILEWRKGAGDSVAAGDEIAEIETDKATMVYEADVSGLIIEIVAAAGETAGVGSVIARVGDSADEVGRDAVEGTRQLTSVGVRSASVNAKARPGAVEQAPQLDSVRQRSVIADARRGDVNGAGGNRRRIVASPLARRIAEGLGVDLGLVEGSGPAGRIVKLDVEAAEASRALATAAKAQRPPPESAKGEITTVEATRIQRLVARRMSESKATAPHIYLTKRIDMSHCVAARSRLKASKDSGLVPSFNDMVVRACAMALRAHPRINGAYVDGHFELHSRVNVGIAVATDDSLVVPTVFDADLKSLQQIASESRALAGDVRDGKITPPQLSGGTFTVSNLGMYGISSFAAVINPPQAAILAVAEISEIPVVRDGSIAVGHSMEAVLACDHRILTGAEGATFLAAFSDALTQPAALAGFSSGRH